MQLVGSFPALASRGRQGNPIGKVTEIMTKITLPELQAKIEQQKREAMIGTVHVMVDSGNDRDVTQATASINGICGQQFDIIPVGPSVNPRQLCRQIASACPRLLVAAVCDLTEKATADWVSKSLPQFVSQMPFADVFYIDASSLSTEDRSYLNSLRVWKSPTVVVFKMGHQVDSYEIPLQSLPQSISEQLAARNQQILSDPKNQAIIDIESCHPRDPGREAYEERERQRMLMEKKKEDVEKMRERARVQAMINQQRRDRQQGRL